MCEIKLYRELELNIKELRKVLIETGIKKGLNHQETLKYSQNLDKLIFKQSLISKQ
ncbi:aspartyl-phosphate phosphatase Spo0E family protein [Shigella flexneri]|uniref:aspartyl-phosphate phosphatase Spo0E family protein n=1 Tax=Peribacillus frigoritolerans TaxID=450367 RepID=UPI001993B8DE|nr:aspartyl-phosphate phosphatase Spo0E family protein [Shigella flexneri]MCP1097196.1 aspartyl-phosphate phosphatase Spo0E family protein [Bacillaceae bacterium OS4b]